jgi:hypothetical protein
MLCKDLGGWTMTYPDNPKGLVSTGFFTEKGKKGQDLRQHLAAVGMEWFRLCQNERLAQERQWFYNYAFYTGNQHVQFKQAKQGGPFDLYVPKAPPWRVRIVINKVRQTIRKEVSRLTAQKPNAFVVPSSAEDGDVFAAQAGSQIWDSLWRRLEFNKTLRKAVFWQAVVGNGFIKSYWDATKVDPNNKEIPGDVCIENINPFHIFVPDLLCEEIEEQPYIIQAQIKSNAWIRQNLGIEAVSNKLESVDDAMQSVMGVHRNMQKRDQSVILEIWVKPGYLPELPNGGIMTIAADQLVQGMDYLPYTHGQYPFAKLDAILTGKFYTSSIIEDIIPLQQELNRTRAQIVEAKNRMAKPQLVAEKGSVEPRKITTEPGQVIEYATGFQPPQPLPLAQLPSYVTDEINRLYTDIADLTGQHEVSNGSTPPGVTAATAISFLQEQDESMIASHYTSIEEAIEKVAGQCLTYVQMYWDEERTVKVVGLEGSFDVRTFKGATLRGNTDIRVETGSSLPTSRAAKQAFIMDLMKMGFIPPEQGLEIMEVGAINRIYEDLQIDKRQAQRENLKMSVVKEEDIMAHQQAWMQEQGEKTVDPTTQLRLDPPPIVPVHTYDNHEVHIQIHNDYRKSQNFENASPTTKRLFEEHVRQHEEALSNMMMHPLTGMDDSDPNAPAPEEEEMMMDQMEQEEAQQPPGPEAMPQLEGGGMVQ